MRGAENLRYVGPLLAALASLVACESRDRGSQSLPAATNAASASTVFTRTTAPSSHSAPVAPAPPQPPAPMEPKDETDKIVSQWLKSLPSYELHEKMCPIFESLKPTEPLDGWGTPTRTTCHPAKIRYGMPTYLVVSAGPDRQFDTADDIAMPGVSYTMETWGTPK